MYTFKNRSCKKTSQSVYTIGTTCFDERFSFHVIIGRHYLLQKFIVRGFLEPPYCWVL